MVVQALVEPWINGNIAMWSVATVWVEGVLLTVMASIAISNGILKEQSVK